MEVLSRPAGFMLNHVPDFRNVYEATYREGRITTFGIASTDPFQLDGTCKVTGVFKEYPDAESDFIPIVYNCKRCAYSDEGTRLEGNNSINGAPMAFKIGDTVRVMMQGDLPACVLSFANSPPRMCKDLFQISLRSWFAQAGTTNHLIHFSLAGRGVYSGFGDECQDSYGFGGQFNREGIRLFGKREFQVGTVINFWGDWLVRVGPVAIIFQMKSVGLPGPMTGAIWASAGLWSEEAQAEWIAHGEAKERTLPRSPLQGPGGILQTPYPGVTQQTELTAALVGVFFGIMKFPYPRWVYTKLYGQKWSYED